MPVSLPFHFAPSQTGCMTRLSWPMVLTIALCGSLWVCRRRIRWFVAVSALNEEVNCCCCRRIGAKDAGAKDAGARLLVRRMLVILVALCVPGGL